MSNAAAAPLAAVPPHETEEDPAGTGSSESELRIRYDSAQTRLREYKASNNKSHETIAKELGPQPGKTAYWSASTISVFLSGAYDLSSIGNILPAVERLLSRIEERQQLILQPVFAKTSVARAILAFIKRCELFTKIGIIGAEPGIGKTEALRYFARTNPTSIFIPGNRTYSPCSAYSRANSSAMPLLRKLADLLGASGTRGGVSQTQLYDAIVERLHGSRRVVVIDQAHWLPVEAFDVFTTLIEDAGVPVILAGHTGTYDRGPRDHESFVAFRRRALRIKLLTTSITQADVNLIAEQILDVGVARDAAKRLLIEAHKPGGLSWVVSILQEAQTYGDSKVTLDHVTRAIDELPPPVATGATGGAK